MAAMLLYEHSRPLVIELLEGPFVGGFVGLTPCVNI